MITRRKLLIGAAVVPVAAVPLMAQDGEEQAVLRLWRALPDDKRALAHSLLRSFNGLDFDPEVWARHDDRPLSEYLA